MIGKVECITRLKMKTKKCFCDKHKGKEISVELFYKSSQKGGYQHECKEAMGVKRLEKKSRKEDDLYDPQEFASFYRRGAVIKSRVAL
jgi:hypothetical protein